MNSSDETGTGDLELWFAKCQAAEFGFTLSQFCAMITEALCRLLPEPHTAVDRRCAMEKLRLDELVLARACARGSQTAWDRFLVLYRDKVHGAALALAREESGARELADSLYADLFGTRTRQDGSRISKLESYLGRGSLEGWLKVVLAQQYVDRFREQRKLVPFDDDVELQPAMETVSPGEREITLVAQVTDTALEKLSPEQRFLLAAYYLDGRTLAEIGRMLNAHESTIKRRLDKTVHGLRKAIVAGLCQAGVRKAAAHEMLQVDVRDLGIDIRDRLTQER